jgi:hypothetical protein
VLVANFLEHSINDETISEYKIKGKKLVSELINFTKTFNEEDEG